MPLLPGVHRVDQDILVRLLFSSRQTTPEMVEDVGCTMPLAVPIDKTMITAIHRKMPRYADFISLVEDLQNQ